MPELCSDSLSLRYLLRLPLFAVHNQIKTFCAKHKLLLTLAIAQYSPLSSLSIALTSHMQNHKRNNSISGGVGANNSTGIHNGNNGTVNNNHSDNKNITSNTPNSLRHESRGETPTTNKV